MQSVSAALAAAITARDRQPLVRLRCDWDRSGSFTDLPVKDLSADVVGIDTSNELETDLPVQAKLFTGSAAAEATITLAHRDPGGDPARHTGWYYSPLNAASPLAAYRRVEAPALLELGMVGDNGPEYVTVLTGRIRSLQVQSGGAAATMRISDLSEDFHKQVQLPPIIADDEDASNHRPGLNTTFLADWVARRCGYYASPPARTGCKMLTTEHGSGWPEVGTIRAHYGATGSKLSYAPNPDFPDAAKWVMSVGLNGTTTQAIQYELGGTGTLGTNNGRTFLFEGWFKLTSTAVDQPLFLLFTAGAATPYASVFWQTSTSQFKATFNRGTTDTTDRAATGPTVSPGTTNWHYYGVHMSFTSTGVDVTFRYDGTTTGPVTVATPSVTGSAAFTSIALGRGRVSAFADSNLTGRLEACQVTTEATAGSWNNNFTPTAQIHATAAYENKLVATPAVTENGWNLLQELARADFATVGFDETGMLTWWPRDRWTTPPYDTSQLTLTPTTTLKELATTEAADQVRNHIIIRAVSPTVGTPETIWKLGSRWLVGAGRTITKIASWLDPVGNLDTGVVFGTALGSSRYLAGTAIDGTGTSVSNLVITVTVLSPTSARITINNPNGFSVFFAGDANDSATYAGKPYLWLDGQRIVFSDDNGTLVDASDATSISTFGEQLLEVADSQFRQDDDDIQLLADALLADLADPGPAITSIPCVGDPRVQLGDRVTVVDTDGMGMSQDFHVSAVNFTFTPSEGLTMTLNLRAA